MLRNEKKKAIILEDLLHNSVLIMCTTDCLNCRTYYTFLILMVKIILLVTSCLFILEDREIIQENLLLKSVQSTIVRRFNFNQVH